VAKEPEYPDLALLLESWEIGLAGERKSPATIKPYRDGVTRFLSWCAETGHDPIPDKATVTAFTADLLKSGAQPATARSRQHAPAAILQVARHRAGDRGRPARWNDDT
jgi:integrase/recombinase XerD